MSLSGYWSDLLSGQSFGSTDTAQALSDKTDAALIQSNADLVSRGVWTQQQADAANSDIGFANTTPDASTEQLQQQYAAEAAGTAPSYQPIDVAGQVTTAAEQGAIDGAKKISAAASAGAGFSLKLLWNLLPWWIWVGLGLWLYWWLIGGKSALVKRLGI